MVNTKPYFRAVVAAGRTHTSVVRRGGLSQGGRTMQVDVVETYVPVNFRQAYASSIRKFRNPRIE